MVAILSEMDSRPVVPSCSSEDQAPHLSLELGLGHWQNAQLTQVSGPRDRHTQISSQKHPNLELPPLMCGDKRSVPAEQVVARHYRVDSPLVPLPTELVESSGSDGSLHQPFHWYGHVADLQHGPHPTTQEGDV